MQEPLYVEKQLGSFGIRAPWETGCAVGEAVKQPRSSDSEKLPCWRSYDHKRRKLPQGDINQTNMVGCGDSWKCTGKKKNGKSCLSPFQRKKKTGSQARWTQKQEQALQQNGTKGRDTGHTYEVVLKQPECRGRSQDLSSESSLHYADIQVCSRPQPHSVQRMKHQQSRNRTEYAILRFPQAKRHYDSKNGTLV